MKSGLNPITSTLKRKTSPIPQNSPLVLHYIWPNSIPDSWKKIFEQKHISIQQVDKSGRKTLEFLKETQQYIKHITKPMADYKNSEISKSNDKFPKLRKRTQNNQFSANRSGEIYRDYEHSPDVIKLIKMKKGKLHKRLAFKSTFQNSLKSFRSQKALNAEALTDRKSN